MLALLGLGIIIAAILGTTEMIALWMYLILITVELWDDDYDKMGGKKALSLCTGAISIIALIMAIYIPYLLCEFVGVGIKTKLEALSTKTQSEK